MLAIIYYATVTICSLLLVAAIVRRGREVRRRERARAQLARVAEQLPFDRILTAGLVRRVQHHNRGKQ